MDNQETENRVFGMSEKAVLEYLQPQIDRVGRDMLVASILSDAQHLIEIGDTDQARQFLNRAKLVLFEIKYTEEDQYLFQRRRN